MWLAKQAPWRNESSSPALDDFMPSERADESDADTAKARALAAALGARLADPGRSRRRWRPR